MTPFKIKDYPFGELAQLYYPDRNYQSALRLFREERHVASHDGPRLQGEHQDAHPSPSENHRPVPRRAVILGC